MDMQLNRRQVMKLAMVFAALWAGERVLAMDGAPREADAGGGRRDTSPGGDKQNLHAVGASSNFKAVYGDPQLRAAFLLFLQNVYHIYPEDRFHRLLEEVSVAGATDKEIYLRAQARLGEIKPVLASLRYSLPALSKQKAEMTRQTLELIGAERKLNGYMEIGTTGRYIGRLRSDIVLDGDVVLLHSEAPGWSPTDVVERGGLGKIGRFVPMQNYASVAPADVADGSLDVVANFIGFHHSPLDRLDPFVRSLHRVLRPGGRLIVRDHDVDSNRMNRIVALAHDVFNMGLGTNWSVNQQELRHFTSLNQLTTYLTQRGFRRDPRAVFQEGDPTRNALMVFTKV